MCSGAIPEKWEESTFNSWKTLRWCKQVIVDLSTSNHLPYAFEYLYCDVFLCDVQPCRYSPFLFRSSQQNLFLTSSFIKWEYRMLMSIWVCKLSYTILTIVFSFFFCIFVLPVDYFSHLTCGFYWLQYALEIRGWSRSNGWSGRWRRQPSICIIHNQPCLVSQCSLLKPGWSCTSSFVRFVFPCLVLHKESCAQIFPWSIASLLRFIILPFDFNALLLVYIVLSKS